MSEPRITPIMRDALTLTARTGEAGLDAPEHSISGQTMLALQRHGMVTRHPDGRRWIVGDCPCGYHLSDSCPVHDSDECAPTLSAARSAAFLATIEARQATGRTTIPPQNMNTYLREHGPVDVLVDGTWSPLSRVVHVTYWSHLVCLDEHGEHTHRVDRRAPIEVRAHIGDPLPDTTHTPPAARDQRVVHGGTLWQYIGAFEVLTPRDGWQPIIGADTHRSLARRPLVCTPTSPVGFYADDVETIRPIADPAERLGMDDWPHNCRCASWFDGRHTGELNPPLARYQNPNCPIHPTSGPSGPSGPAGDRVHLAGDRVQLDPGHDAHGAPAGPDGRCLLTDCLGTVVRTFVSDASRVAPSISPARTRWYEIETDWAPGGDLVAVPAGALHPTSQPDPSGREHLAVVEVDQQLTTGRPTYPQWTHRAAYLTPAGGPGQHHLDELAERVAAVQATTSDRPIRVTVQPVNDITVFAIATAAGRDADLHWRRHATTAA